MIIYRPDTESFLTVEKEGKKYVNILKKEVFDQFNPSLLGLGDIKKPSIATNAICAIYDLGGFTNFCKQIDPQLSISLYLSGFLNWIFQAIRKEAVHLNFEEGVKLYHALPFYMKFIGDGLLILWDTSDMSPIAQHNLIVTQYFICTRYLSEFLPGMKKKVCDPPDSLRCGMTKGTIYSVGDGNDFVGPCINLAARIQKLPGVIFAFARRGFDPESEWKDAKYLKEIKIKKVAIRGLGYEELIYIRKADFKKMSKDDQNLYHDP